MYNSVRLSWIYLFLLYTTTKSEDVTAVQTFRRVFQLLNTKVDAERLANCIKLSWYFKRMFVCSIRYKNGFLVHAKHLWNTLKSALQSCTVCFQIQCGGTQREKHKILTTGTKPDQLYSSASCTSPLSTPGSSNALLIMDKSGLEEVLCYAVSFCHLF